MLPSIRSMGDSQLRAEYLIGVEACMELAKQSAASIWKIYIAIMDGRRRLVIVTESEYNRREHDKAITIYIIII